MTTIKKQVKSNGTYRKGVKFECNRQLKQQPTADILVLPKYSFFGSFIPADYSPQMTISPDKIWVMLLTFAMALFIGRFCFVASYTQRKK